MWRLPGALLWLPTAVNAFLLAEIVQLWWQRSHGGHNTAQGDFEIAMHILAASVPISGLLLVGSGIFAALRTRVAPGPASKRELGVLGLVALNVVAPILLYFGLRWLARARACPLTARPTRSL
jgi:hypothetical protein